MHASDSVERPSKRPCLQPEQVMFEPSDDVSQDLAFAQVIAAPLNNASNAKAEHLAAAEGLMLVPAESGQSSSSAGAPFANDAITHTAQDGRAYCSATVPLYNSALAGADQIMIARHGVAPSAPLASQQGATASITSVSPLAEAVLPPMAEAQIAIAQSTAAAPPAQASRPISASAPFARTNAARVAMRRMRDKSTGGRRKSWASFSRAPSKFPSCLCRHGTPLCMRTRFAPTTGHDHARSRKPRRPRSP